MKPFRVNLVSKYRNEIYGLSILWIVLFHGSAIDRIDYSFGIELLAPLQSLLQSGNVGVDVFLFLSGVCLYYSFSKNPNIQEFYKRRLVRIIPAVWIINGLYWLIKFGILQSDSLAFLARMACVQFWLSGDASIWYVSLILVLYLAYPFIYKLLFYKESAAGYRCIFLMGATYLAVISVSYLNPDYYKLVEIAITRIPVFILGCYVGRAVKRGKELPKFCNALVIAAIVVFFAVTATHALSGMQMRFFYLIGGVSISYGFAMACSWMHDLLSTPPNHCLCDYSLSSASLPSNSICRILCATR